MEYTVELAGIPIRLRTRTAFDACVLAPFAAKTSAVPVPAADAVSSPEYTALWQRSLPEGTPAWIAEYHDTAAAVSEALLPFGRCVFHGMAFLWRGKAWILTAPSGVGKTTQYALWKILYGDEVSAMNGDKPILECRTDGTVIVHPSPWQGKENFGSMASAPLGGIVCLSRGEENRIRRLQIRDALIPLYCQIIYYAESREKAVHALSITERLLSSVPVWELRNVGDRASAALTHDTLLEYEERAK